MNNNNNIRYAVFILATILLLHNKRNFGYEEICGEKLRFVCTKVFGWLFIVDVNHGQPFYLWSFHEVFLFIIAWRN